MWSLAIIVWMIKKKWKKKQVFFFCYIKPLNRSEPFLLRLIPKLLTFSDLYRQASGSKVKVRSLQATRIFKYQVDEKRFDFLNSLFSSLLRWALVRKSNKNVRNIFYLFSIRFRLNKICFKKSAYFNVGVFIFVSYKKAWILNNYTNKLYI